MLSFAFPWLLLLALLPLIGRYILPAYRETKRGVQVPFLPRLAQVTGETPGAGAIIQKPGRIQGWLHPVMWTLIVVAASRPQWIEPPIERELPMRDLLLLVDLSGSMETKDFQTEDGTAVDRLTAVKQVLDDFLARRDGDRVGLIFFGTAPFLQAPFTPDLDVCRELLDEATVRMAGPQTKLGDAIGLAINTFEDSDAPNRVAILLTDGNDTGSFMPPERAADVAKDRGIVIHTVAVGDPTAAGEDKLDLDSLRLISTTTGGQTLLANDRDELESVYEKLDRLETRQVKQVTYRPKKDLYYLPVVVMLLISMGIHTWVLTLGSLLRRRLLAQDQIARSLTLPKESGQ